MAETKFSHKSSGEPGGNEKDVTADFAFGKVSIKDTTFKKFQALVYREAGISLGPTKKSLLVGRLMKRLRALQLSSFDDYYDHVVGQKDRSELVQMLNQICTNETSFFRHPSHFEFIRDRILPTLVQDAEKRNRAPRLRAWSAGCSSGEEPASLAMTFLDALPTEPKWDVRVLATDLSTKALDKAKEFLWPVEKASQIPADMLKKFMLRGVDKQIGKMRVGPQARAIIDFQRLNLNSDTYPSDQNGFDIIMCRNVLIYFDTESRMRVVNGLIDRLAPNGFLFLGSSESLNRVTDRVRSAGPTVYQKV
ncbi:MAG: protein-glutamate O-methyltransferase CheR [Gemmatimonadota bacterium]|nr:protein-glutamate O-methyltransferase CheR [Gemmatimonadota bacterium]MDH5804239.1 protein-glutamate O-methyltransferase CheR [Gemmatimonadota bacterium]